MGVALRRIFSPRALPFFVARRLHTVGIHRLRTVDPQCVVEVIGARIVGFGCNKIVRPGLFNCTHGTITGSGSFVKQK